MREKYISIIVLAILLTTGFVITKITVISTIADDRELLECGQFAKDFIHECARPIFEYRVTDYNNGGIIANIWMIPFFYLFGDSLLVLISALLVLYVVEVLALYFFLLKFFNRDIAAISTYYFVFAPIDITVSKFLTMESHSILSFYALLIFICLYSIFFIRQNRQAYFATTSNYCYKRKVVILCIISGVVGGLACFSSLTSWFTLFIVGIAWSSCDSKLFQKKYIWIFLLSFLIGFFPWIIFNISCRFDGLLVQPCHEISYPLGIFFLIKKYLYQSIIVIAIRLWQIMSLSEYYFRYGIFIPYDLPFALMMASMLYGGCVLASVIIQKVFKKKKFESMTHYLKISIIALYVIGYFFLIYRHPKLIPQDFYLLPVLPFVCALIGIFIGAIWNARIGYLRIRFVALFLILIVLAHGFINIQKYIYYNHELFDKEWLQSIVDKKGYIE